MGISTANVTLADELVGNPSSIPVGVAWWRLEEDALATRIDSWGTNDLTPNVTIPNAGGKIGFSNDFQQDGIYLEDNPPGADLVMGDMDFTIAAWVYLTDTSWARYLIPGGIWPISGGRQYMLAYATDLQKFAMFTSSNGVNYDYVAHGTTSTLETWYLAIGWHDSINNQIGIQVNNLTPELKAWVGGVYDGGVSPAPFRINYAVDVAGTTLYGRGRMDEVRLWHKVLSESERAALWGAAGGCVTGGQVMLGSLSAGIHTSGVRLG
ncbi:MAG: hypothetical protein JXC32_20695 [Anaerolineae bacterium]|nr:hypothetical protein [Anaerolineae bacterium]